MFKYLILLLIFLISGCGTIVSKQHQDISVETVPSGAIVRYSDNTSCLTPCVLRVDRKTKPLIVTISKDNYVDKIIILQKDLNPWIFGNLIFGIIGGVVGAAVDGTTGAAFILIPNNISVALQPQEF